MSTITVGRKFSLNHIERALYLRSIVKEDKKRKDRKNTNLNNINFNISNQIYKLNTK